jgi:hypothetical protein
MLSVTVSTDNKMVMDCFLCNSNTEKLHFLSITETQTWLKSLHLFTPLCEITDILISTAETVNYRGNKAILPAANISKNILNLK